MLRMSKLADYGTVVMTAMARAPDHVHSAANVADLTGLALPTVSKVLKTLARERLLASVRGAKGGYVFARNPREISIAQIISAMEGPIGMTECGSAPGLCLQESGCAVRANWQRINHMVLQALDRITVEQMTRPIGRTVEIAAIMVPAPRKRPQGPGMNGPAAPGTEGAQT
jgi:FeS assembly SUF system regulator